MPVYEMNPLLKVTKTHERQRDRENSFTRLFSLLKLCVLGGWAVCLDTFQIGDWIRIKRTSAATPHMAGKSVIQGAIGIVTSKL